MRKLSKIPVSSDYIWRSKRGTEGPPENSNSLPIERKVRESNIHNTKVYSKEKYSKEDNGSDSESLSSL